MSEIEVLRKQLERKDKIDKVLIDISIRFARIDDYDLAIDAFLQHLVELSGYDRAYISMVENNVMSFTHEACNTNRPPIKHRIQQVPYREMPWFKQIQLERGYAAVCSPEEIPASAHAEQELFQKYQMKACLTKAFVSNVSMRGFVNIQHSQVIDKWDDDIIQLVTFGATLLSHTLEQRFMRQELIAAKEQAEQSDRLKTAFLANISHEIRTPLNAIVGFSRLINTQSPAHQEKNQRFARIIESNSKQLITVISDILDIAKIESGIVTVSETSFYLTQFLNDIFLQHYESTLNRQTIKIQIEIPDNENLLIHTDEMKLKQVLDNLIRNAIKFTPQGSITFGYKRIKNNLHFYVKDTGIGIAPEHFDVIFERFKQVDDSSTRSYGGSGLGLAICINLVKLLGGNMSLESNLREGSTFYFNIPYVAGNELLINTKSNLAFINIDNEFLGKRFLIVDDSEDSRLYLKLLLESAGASCETASNGKDALNFFATETEVDAMLLDIQMPDMTGNDVLAEVHRIKPTLPVVAVTAHAMNTEREHIIRSGFKNFIPKPVSRDELFPLLQKIVRN